jgi:hypothetical protein
MKRKISFAAYNLAIGQDIFPTPAAPFKGQIGLSAKDKNQ